MGGQQAAPKTRASGDAMARATVEGLQFADDKKEYIINTLDPVLEAMVGELMSKMPSDPVQFMIEFLSYKAGDRPEEPVMSLKEKNKFLRSQLNSMKAFVGEVGEMLVADANAAAGGGADNEKEDASEEEEDDDEGDDEPPPPPPSTMRARQSVSAEAYGMWNQKKDFDPPKYEKTAEQTERLKGILSASFLFSKLSEKDLDVILLAMKQTVFEPGQRIINEGDDGDYLFVIEEGKPECKKLIDGEQKVVKICSPGDVFGELALLYNSKRAASVDATDKCIAWQLDRETFTHIVKEAASKQTNMYKDFLKKVSVFLTLDEYQLSQISDALKSETRKKDDFIVRQGEQGNRFYIVESGTLAAFKKADGSEEEAKVMEYGTGSYFGELAMLKDQPRAASVKVTSDTAVVLYMERKSFKGMIGSLTEILNKSSNYA